MKRIPTKEIYCPHPHESHPDHMATADITFEAIRKSGLTVRLLHYVVWTWFDAPWGIKKKLDLSKSFRLNIRQAIWKKSKAIDRYLNGEKTPCGIPYCGKLPRSLIYCARMKDEIFFDSTSQ
jgi:hypothetical protein